MPDNTGTQTSKSSPKKANGSRLMSPVPREYEKVYNFMFYRHSEPLDFLNDLTKQMIEMNAAAEQEEFPFNKAEAMSLAPLIGLDTGPNNGKRIHLIFIS